MPQMVGDTYGDDASFCSEDSFFADGGYETKLSPATDLNGALEGAAAAGNMELLQSLVEAGADINFAGGHCYCPPLCLAIRENHTELVKWLVKHPEIDINKHDCSGSTPLKKARQQNLGEIVKILLDCGAKDNTLITEAEDIITVDRLIQECADINTPDNENGNTVLHRACSSYVDDDRQVNYIIQLLERGAKVNVRNKEGATPLHAAARKSNMNAVTVLLEKGGAHIDAVDGDGRTPFLFSSKPDMMGLLLEQGADVNSRDDSGNNLLHRMCSLYEIAHGQTEACIALLLGAGIDLNAKGYKGNTPLIKAIGSRVSGKIFERFLKDGADPNIVNDKGWNALHTVSDIGWGESGRECVDLLLRTSAVDVNEPTKDGATALHLQIWSGRDAISKLLKHGADVNARARNGSTPLGGAIGRPRNLNTIKLLLDHGADVNGITTWPEEEPDYHGYGSPWRCVGDTDKGKYDTPLLMAIKAKREDVALLLLEHGADPSATNEKHESPLLLAPTLGLKNVVNCLLKMAISDGSWDPMKE